MRREKRKQETDKGGWNHGFEVESMCRSNRAPTWGCSLSPALSSKIPGLICTPLDPESKTHQCIFPYIDIRRYTR